MSEGGYPWDVFCDEGKDLVIKKKSFPDFNLGDVVEVSQQLENGEISRVLLTVDAFSEDCKPESQEYAYNNPGVLSLNEAVMKKCSFQRYSDVNVKKIEDIDSVSVDLVVVQVKEAYLSRRDMWVITQSLKKKCCYLLKRVDYLPELRTSMQLTISEIWKSGEELTCGYVTERTRVCFRSSSATIHIFLQMSSEMWEFDSYGDLYYEKAVNGFLTELFGKWKKYECTHDVTIVFFSRIFYSATNMEDFQPCVRSNIQTNNHGRFYEDFYRVVVQNERYDDWTMVLRKLKRHFIDYKEINVLDLTSANGQPIRAQLSSAAQGNLLEVMSFALNLYEKHYVDHNFDRVGKIAIMITPGPGVFEVDRDLMTLTKQRTIDSGCAADLICMGEQPMHAVPLFKFCSNTSQAVDYSIPHWINHSFYMSQCQLAINYNSEYVCRVKPASRIDKEEDVPPKIHDRPGDLFMASLPVKRNEDGTYSDLDDDDECDAHDAAMIDGPSSAPFTISPSAAPPAGPSDSRVTLSSIGESVELKQGGEGKSFQAHSLDNASSIGSGVYEASASGSRRSGMHVESSEEEMEESAEIGNARTHRESGGSGYGMSAGATGSSLGGPSAQLGARHYTSINPFMASQIRFRNTSNRRRWAHAFPPDKDGKPIQPHHRLDDSHLAPDELPFVVSHIHQKVLKQRAEMRKQRSLFAVSNRARDKKLSTSSSQGAASPDNSSSSYEDWSPMDTTGVDWRSLTRPALLPVTTDYFPEKTNLTKKFSLSASYSVEADPARSVGVWYVPASEFEPKLSTNDYLNELVRTRILMGYQLITLDSDQGAQGETPAVASALQPKSGLVKAAKPKKKFYLSIGKIFHTLFLTDDESIAVTIQKPWRTVEYSTIGYKYRFMGPDAVTYGVCETTFSTEELAAYKWNYVDNYVLNDIHDVDRHHRTELLKYWRVRFFVLPYDDSATKTILEAMKAGKPGQHVKCDVYTGCVDQEKLVQNFIKLLDFFNHIRRADSVDAKKPSQGEQSGAEAAEHGQLSYDKILKLMMEKGSGMKFLKDRRFPEHSFLSYEAAQWLVANMPSITSIKDATAMLKAMAEKRLIVHAIDRRHCVFRCGYVIYHVNSAKSEEEDSRWVNSVIEVEISESGASLESGKPPAPPSTSLDVVPRRRRYSNVSFEKLKYKDCVKSVDPLGTSQQEETVTLNHHAHYAADCAFDLEINWMTVTTQRLYQMLFNWGRKAAHFGFQLYPVPVDMFAHLRDHHSDPLRGPIPVPLYSKEFSGKRWSQVHSVKQEILKRFGFIPIGITTQRRTDNREFVHHTGGMFVYIPDAPSMKELPTESGGDNSDAAEGATCMEPVGFLWSWNFMSNNSWRLATKQEDIMRMFEAFQDNMLYDFRLFCQNEDNRLSEFLTEINMANSSI